MKKDNNIEKQKCKSKINKVIEYIQDEFLPYSDLDNTQQRIFESSLEKVQTFLKCHCRRTYRLNDCCIKIEQGFYKELIDIPYIIDICDLFIAYNYFMTQIEIEYLSDVYFMDNSLMKNWAKEHNINLI